MTESEPTVRETSWWPARNLAAVQDITGCGPHDFAEQAHREDDPSHWDGPAAVGDGTRAQRGRSRHMLSCYESAVLAP